MLLFFEGQQFRVIFSALTKCYPLTHIRMVGQRENHLTHESTMGMYDDVTCEHALPGEPKPKDNYFQTKDFDRLMDHYTITADGRLLKEKAEVQFHGMLNFYTYTNDDMWFEYEAKFTDGRLIEIQPISIYRNGAGGSPRVFYPLPDRPTAPADTASEQGSNDE